MVNYGETMFYSLKNIFKINLLEELDQLNKITLISSFDTTDN